ncbi:uncharacterized protein LOC100201799 isoform X1 [Hydra vulgaris]|uniref:uncharacterized protein LOC100201799 isoform X1 n=1 Tax=Hydra vulgaris TaxID=6087 RepID=UPI0032EA6C22
MFYMNKYLINVIFITLLSLFKVSYSNKCADGWLGYNSYCYLFHTVTPNLQGKTWKTALFLCQSYGGNLLSIADQAENAFLIKNFKNNITKYWIGLNALQNNRTFTWSDNTTSLFSNWKPDEPNNFQDSNEECVETTINGWNDNNCNRFFGYICKVKRDKLQPNTNLATDYINHKEEFAITHGLLLGTLNVLKREYTISFSLKPPNFVKGLKNIVSLTMGNISETYGYLSLNVWFYKNGSEKLLINFTLSGNPNFYVETSLSSSQFFNIEVCQSFKDGNYMLAIDINGQNIGTFENIKSKDFKNIQVYITSFQDSAQNGFISDLLIVNGKAEFFVGNIITPLVKGKVVAIIPKLAKEFLISFDVYPNNFAKSFQSVIHFIMDGQDSKTGVPGIWLNEDGKGGLYISALINGNLYSSFITNPIQLAAWTNVEIYQTSKGSFYQFTIKINGEIIVYDIVKEIENLENVIVYASNPWSVQNGSIKSFFIVNGNDSRIEHIVLQPNTSSKTDIKMQSIGNLKSDKSLVIIATVIFLVIVFFVAVFIVVFRILRKKKKSEQPKTIESDMDCDTLPFDEWEVLPENIVLDKQIGEGAFGTVFIAKMNSKVLTKRKSDKYEFLSNTKEESFVNVAVKLLKDCPDQSEFNDFYEEINLMKEIGYHKNIINMIGCSTNKKPLCLIVELMENGDLLSFLRKRRTKLCASKVEGETAGSLKYTQSYQQFLETTTNENLSSGVMSKEFLSDEIITPEDLLSIAWQVASGMEYLSCINLVHRDLAARNVLVGSKKIVKISDFGLTRKVNDNLQYMSSKNRRLPIKWMAVEAIFDQTFTTYSDVWAYGVVLFEIVTLGGTPYPTINNRELLTLLKSGYRMDQPENCSELMYNIMLQCWNEDPLKRPTFTELREHFDKIISEGDCYFNFELNENNIYYTAASFNSFSSKTENEELENEIFQKPIHVQSIKKIKELNDKPLNIRYTYPDSLKPALLGFSNYAFNDVISEI